MNNSIGQFFIFPLNDDDKALNDWCGRRFSKYPKSLKHLLRATNDNYKAKAILEHNSNIAILTGRKSGIIVVDVDFHKGGKDTLEKLNLPKTKMVKSPNGVHLYFKHPKNILIPSSTDRIGKGIDVMADFSYIKAPPSKNYEWVNEEDMADLSEELLRKLSPRYPMVHLIYFPLKAVMLYFYRRFFKFPLNRTFKWQ